MVSFNENVASAEEGIVRRRVRQIETSNTANKSRTSHSMGWLLRQSFGGAGMFKTHANSGSHQTSSWPLSAAQARPQSVYVISLPSDDKTSSKTPTNYSRRCSIDTSELSYTSNGRRLSDIWTRMGDIDQSKFIVASKRQQPPTATLAVSETSSDDDDNSNAELTTTNDHDNKRHAGCRSSVDSRYSWLILAVVFWINATIFGAGEVYGLIYEQSTRGEYKRRTNLALPFSTMGAVQNMAGPVCGAILALTSSWRITVGFGSLLVTLGHLSASYWPDSLGQLLSMGLITGFGLGFINISLFQVTNAYFHKYRRLASAIGLSGAAFGTLFISPVCHHLLDHYHGPSMCYFALSLMIAPNILLAMLLKPLVDGRQQVAPDDGGDQKLQETVDGSKESITTTSESTVASSLSVPDDKQIMERNEQHQNIHKGLNVQWDYPRADEALDIGALTLIKLVFVNPYFHLLWPTQILFHWFEFTISLVTVDFVTDRKMSTEEASWLVPVWAFGQVFGHILFGLTIDLRMVTFRTWNIISYLSLATLVWSTRFAADLSDFDDLDDLFFIAVPVFLLSMFVCLWHVLLHELVQHYIEESLQPLSLGISSFISSFFLLPRAHFIGYYYGRNHSYNCTLFLFTFIGMGITLIWLFVPLIYKYLMHVRKQIRRSSQEMQEKYPKYCAAWTHEGDPL